MKRNTHILLLAIALFCTISAYGNKPQINEMYCRYCGKQIPVDSKYCQYCGKQQNNDAAPSSNKINGHEYVDLGLSVKWATCNVGASSPSDYGNYYAWGETSTKSSYTEENSVTYGKDMGSIAGDPEYDAATANWGSPWRLPTKEEIEELVIKCSWEWTTQGGHNGYKIIGPNGNSIFLPAAGSRIEASLFDAGEDGLYWSAAPSGGFAFVLSCGLLFYSGFFDEFWDGRYYGQSVRPVTE